LSHAPLILTAKVSGAFWPGSGGRISPAEASPFHVGQRRERPFDVNEKPFDFSAYGAEIAVPRQHQEGRGVAWNGLQILASRFDSGRGLKPIFTRAAIRPAPLI